MINDGVCVRNNDTYKCRLRSKVSIASYCHITIFSVEAMIMIIRLMILVFVYVEAVPEVNHMIEIDQDGRKVAMDVIHDAAEKTVIVIIGDVCKYKDGALTVNFHDYSTGYGAIKNINKQTCIITKSPLSMASDKKYRIGWTTEVHDHILNILPDKVTYEEVKALAGPKVADFCKDYASLYASVTPVERHRRDVGLTSFSGLPKAWCLFSRCILVSA